MKAINNIASLDSLVLTFLVFSAYLRMTELDPLAPLIIARTIAIRKAIAEITKLQAHKLVNNALHYRNGPNTTLVHDLPFNLEVLV